MEKRRLPKWTKGVLDLPRNVKAKKEALDNFAKRKYLESIFRYGPVNVEQHVGICVRPKK